jgi:nucleotide-binding universal stress UspA family protein
MAGCIICGVDDSPGTSEAVLVARNWRERLGLRLVLLNATRVPVVVGASGVPHAYDELREAAIKESKELLTRISEEHALGATTECRVELGDPVERLTAVATEEGAHLVVVGSRGRGPLKSALLGSVSHALAGKAPCPVVIVPAGAASESSSAEPRPARRPEVVPARPRRSREARQKGGARDGRPSRTVLADLSPHGELLGGGLAGSEGSRLRARRRPWRHR